MRRTVLCLCLLAALAPLAFTKDKLEMPSMVVHARYVFITTLQGDPYSARVFPEDRQAVFDVRDALRKWGRYIVVTRQQDAELIVLVRKGRLAEAMPGVRIQAGSQKNPSVGPEVRGDVGDPRDMLAVYDASSGIDSAPLWRAFLDKGLDPTSMSLVKEFQSVIEAAAKKKP